MRRKNELIVNGAIDLKGQLKMFMGELRQFMSNYKGRKIIVKFTVIEKETSSAMRGYYYQYVVPTFKKAVWESGERMTDEKCEEFMRQLSPIMQDQENIDGKYITRLRTIKELSNNELMEHIDIIKQIAAEEYSLYIEDPKQY